MSAFGAEQRWVRLLDELRGWGFRAWGRRRWEDGGRKGGKEDRQGEQAEEGEFTKVSLLLCIPSKHIHRKGTVFPVQRTTAMIIKQLLLF